MISELWHQTQPSRKLINTACRLRASRAPLCHPPSPARSPPAIRPLSTPFSSLSSGVSSFPPSAAFSFGFSIRPPAPHLSRVCVSAPGLGLCAALPVRPVGCGHVEDARGCPAHAAAGDPAASGTWACWTLSVQEPRLRDPHRLCWRWGSLSAARSGTGLRLSAVAFLALKKMAFQMVPAFSLLPCSSATKVVLLSLPFFFGNLSRQQIAGGNYAVC